MGTQTIDPSSLYEVAKGEPARAMAAGLTMLTTCEGQERVLVLRAMGVAHTRLGLVEEGYAYLKQSLSEARAMSAPDLEAQISISIATSLVILGHSDHAISQLKEASTNSAGPTKAEALFQLANTYRQLGDATEAMRVYETVLPLIRQHGMVANEAALHSSCGEINFHRHRYRQALRDLEAAERLHLSLDEYASYYSIMSRRARSLSRLGEYTQAMTLFEQARDGLRTLGVGPGEISADQCETLIALGQFERALAHSEAAATYFNAIQAKRRQFEAYLLGAEVALVLNRPGQAEHLVEQALQIDFERAPHLRGRAHLAHIRCHLSLGTASSLDLERARDLAATLELSAPALALEATIEAAEVNLFLGNLVEAEEILKSEGGRLRRSCLQAQLRYWDLTARIHHALGQSGAALRAVRSGLDHFKTHRYTIGSAATRAEISTSIKRFETVATALLIQSRNATALRETIEEIRSGDLYYSTEPSTAPQGFRDLVSELRTTEADPTHRPATIARLEQLVSEAQAGATPVLVGSDIRPDETALTYIVDQDRLLWRIDSTSDSDELVDCGAIVEIQSLVRRQAFCRRQLLRATNLTPTTLDSLTSEYQTATETLAQRVLPPEHLDRVIINPAPELSGLSWASLPALFERTHVVSSCVHIARRPLPVQFKHVAVMCSGQQRQLHVEAGPIADRYLSLTFVDPSAEALDAVIGADIWHLIGGSRPHQSNPFFDSIDIGSLSIHGFDAVHKAPTLAVLSTCEPQGADPSSTTDGLVSALLTGGSSTIVSWEPLVEIGPRTAQPMARFHELLIEGSSPAEALLQIRTEAPESEAPLLACISLIGAGWA